jgi:hypothetical protein
MTIDKDLFAGSDLDDDDDLTATDRGDTLEPVAEAPTEAPPAEETPPEDEAPPAEETPPEDEASPAESEEGAPKRQPPNARIPKSRFDEVNARRKAAEARAKELEEELARAREPQAPVSEFDFSAKEEEYMAAVVDGNFEKAKTVRAEIRQAEHEAFRIEAQRTQSAAVSQTKAELDLRTTIQELEEMYPALNSKNEETYDDLATQEVLELHNAYLQMGKYPSPADSLRAAAELIAVKYGLNGPETEDVEEPAAPPARRAPAETKAERKAAVAASQPRLPTVGSAVGGTPSIADLSEAEFDALPESKKAELRGDFGL